MFAKLVEKLKKLANVRPPIDGAHFGDPVAVRTAWSPLEGGGTSFCTHRLAELPPARVEFHATGGAKAFAGVFAGLGATVVVLGPVGLLAAGEPLGLVTVGMPVLFGGVFLAVGGWMWRSFTTPIVFDKGPGWFWRGRQEPYQVFDKTELSCATELEHIHALQIIAERCTSDKSHYMSYELNLVLKDGARLCVVDHGKLVQVRSDAAKLAQFLDVPLWDATLPPPQAS